MEEFVGHYCRLLLTFIGFIAPVTSILLSLFQEGIENLRSQYEQKASRYEKEIPPIRKGDKGDLTHLRETAKNLRQQRKRLWFNKNRVQLKIWLLNPRRQTILLFSCLILSFFLANGYFLFKDGVFLGSDIYSFFWIKEVTLIISFLLFILALLDFYLLTGIFIEVRKLSVSEEFDKKDHKPEIIPTEILEFRIDGTSIEEGHNEVIQVTRHQPLSAISLHNISTDVVLGKVRARLVFPNKEFDLSTTDENAQILVNDNDCTEINWTIGSLPCSDCVYIRSLKMNSCSDGEHKLTAYIEIEERVAFERKFTINVVPDEEVKKR